MKEDLMQHFAKKNFMIMSTAEAVLTEKFFPTGLIYTYLKKLEKEISTTQKKARARRQLIQDCVMYRDPLLYHMCLQRGHVIGIGEGHKNSLEKNVSLKERPLFS